MSDFNWDNVLKPKETPSEPQPPRNEETIDGPPPILEEGTAAGHDISTFIPAQKYIGNNEYAEKLEAAKTSETSSVESQEEPVTPTAPPVPSAFGPKAELTDSAPPVLEVETPVSASLTSASSADPTIEELLAAIPEAKPEPKLQLESESISPVAEAMVEAAVEAEPETTLLMAPPISEPEMRIEPKVEKIADAPPVVPAYLSSNEPKAERGPEPQVKDKGQQDRAAAFEGEVARPKGKFGDDFDEIRQRYGISEQTPSVEHLHIDEILRASQDKKASDVHFTVGLPPLGRIDGELQPLGYQPLRQEDIRRLVYEVLTDENIEKFERTHELDFGYTVKGLARFRFNVYMQRGSVAAALRAIPNKIPSFESLHLPQVIRELSKRSSGLVLVTGPTGSGKSTTIATMIDDINDSRPAHIMTIEDPIEYLHRHKRCMVNQREMHSDTYSFHNALRAILREDPDIILVGELRDLETIEAALTLAETGHLVFGTLHTRNAPSTVDRIIDVFPSDQQDQIRVLLGNTLEAVISQQLLPKLGGGRRASLEIMIGTPAIKNLIREGKTHQMYSIIETSKNQGMLTMDSSLAELYRTGNCSFDECLMRSVDRESFMRLAKAAA